MKDKKKTIETLGTIIRARRSVRRFTNAVPPVEEINEILQSAAFAPFGGATGIPLQEIRKVFVFSRETKPMNRATELLLAQMGRGARKMRFYWCFSLFLERKCRLLLIASHHLQKTVFPD